MKEVTIDTVKARIAQLETSEQIGGRLPIRHEFEMACLRQLLACLEVKPGLWEINIPGEGTYYSPHGPRDFETVAQLWYASPQPAPVVEREPIAWLNDAYLARGVVDGEAGSEDAGPGYIPVYREAGPQPAPERDKVRADHAEWSQATFGGVGQIGPLKHLSIEALEAAEAPGDLSEWADLQFLMWDAQRRAGITDEQITQAMIDKLAVNKARTWPEPQDGEPRLHVKCTHAVCMDGCCNAICPECLENIHEVREPVTDNTAQQFEALATSAQPEIIGYEHRLICGELRRVPKFAGQDIHQASVQREPIAVVKHYTGNTYPTLKFAQDEWSVCGDREDVQELADAINALATSAGSGKP